MKLFLKVVLSGILLVSLVLIGFRLAAGAREVGNLRAELPKEGRLVATTEGAVFLLEQGPSDTPTVLFAHGTAAWSGLWRPTLDAVAEAGFHAIAFDMPPFGWSEHAEKGDYSRVRQSDRVIGLLEALDRKPIVVAHSIGAGPISEAVMRRPDLVSGLVVVSGAIALGGHETAKSTPIFLRNQAVREHLVSATVSNPLLTRQFLRSFLFNKDAASPEIVAVLQEPMQREGYTRAVAHWLPQLFLAPQDAMSTRPKNWRDLKLPVGLIWGQEDTVTPVEQAGHLAALVPDAQLVILQGVGHIPQIEDPSAFQDALTEMLQNISDRNFQEADS
ncbi:alpha/beta fold hydrolase [Ruegeria atlantica]|uniref:alpha/beta fold hydrolase n=1 Tax=Ruegeria atlantica TaxID=81569 RepID=UPI00147A25E3|nr:alpha/beta hydrolase [Ruegeria atlantica]